MSKRTLEELKKIAGMATEKKIEEGIATDKDQIKLKKDIHALVKKNKIKEVSSMLKATLKDKGQEAFDDAMDFFVQVAK